MRHCAAGRPVGLRAICRYHIDYPSGVLAGRYGLSMIDFQNASYVKLSQVDMGQVADQINPLLIEGEQAFVAYKGMRDYVVFTSKRIIAVNVQGITGKKKDFTSLPLAKIQAFSVETAGTFDLDAELDLWFSGLGKVKFEFSGRTDVAYLNKLVAQHVL